MKIFKNNIGKFSLLFFSVLFLITRFYRLDSLPIFTDEAIYVRWTQIIKSVETLRFIPLTDGKQPFYMWLSVPFLKFIKDPLIALRTLSVLSGLGLFIGTWVFLGLQTKTKIHSNPLLLLWDSLETNLTPKLILSILFIINTYSLMFDRLASADTMLSMFLVWGIIFTLLQKSYYRVDIALILGGIFGLAWLTKSPAPIFFAISSAYLFLKSKNKKKAIVLSVLSGIVMFGIYSILRLGPQFHMISLRNADYVYPYSHILYSLFDPIRPHAIAQIDIYANYINIFILIIGLFLYTKATSSTKYLNIFLWLVPTVGVLLYAKVFTSRYTLFTLPYLITILSLGWAYLLKKSKLALILFIPLCFLQAKYSYNLVTNPFTLQLPKNDQGYTKEWTAGWGIKDMSEFFISEARSGKNVIVATEGNFGNPKDSIQVYTNNIAGVTVVPQDVYFTKIPDSMQNAKNAGDFVYFVYNSNRVNLDSISKSKVELITSFIKPDQTSYQVYKLL